VARTDRGVCAVNVGECEETLVRQLAGEFPGAILVRDGAIHMPSMADVNACTSEDPLLTTLPIELRRHVLLAKLWSGLR
jgi:hypothetical protein